MQYVYTIMYTVAYQFWHSKPAETILVSHFFGILSTVEIRSSKREYISRIKVEIGTLSDHSGPNLLSPGSQPQFDHYTVIVLWFEHI